MSSPEPPNSEQNPTSDKRDPNIRETAELSMRCPNCHQLIDPDTTICPHCETMLSPKDKTAVIGAGQLQIKPKVWPIGGVIVPEQTIVYFDIQGKMLGVPVGDEVIMGRGGEPDDTMNYVDLSNYGAPEQGVSRRHVKLKVRGNLLYIMDLGSTNGTMLNGRKLFTNSERVLRDGDELYLGHMRMITRFLDAR